MSDDAKRPEPPERVWIQMRAYNQIASVRAGEKPGFGGEWLLYVPEARLAEAARRLAWVESGAIARASGGWYAYTRDGAEHHPTLAAAAGALESKGEHGT